MTKWNIWVCALVLVTATIITSEAHAQRGRGCLFGPRMAYALGITNPQREAIDRLYLNASDSAEPLLRELIETEIELSALVATANLSDSAADELQKTAQELDRKIDDVWTQYRQQVLALLTTEQQQQYDRLARGNGPYGCRRYGRGYGRGMGRHLRWQLGGWGRGRGWRW